MPNSGRENAPHVPLDVFPWYYYPMTSRTGLGVFLIFISVLFFFIRTQPWYPAGAIFNELSGIPWLYALIGTIFGIICAFTIQRQWENWSNLSDAVQTEADALHELWLWSKHFPTEIHAHVQSSILRYLDIVVGECLLHNHHHDEEHEEEILASLNDVLYEVFQQVPALFPTSFSLLKDILRYRAKRIHLMEERMPDVLRFLLFSSSALLVVLSFFIGVHTLWLHYLFFISIAGLIGVLILVVIDLDNPLLPGGWHLTPKSFETLRTRIKKTHTSE